MTKPALLSVVLASLMLTACGNPDTPGGRAADARHENFEELGGAFKTIDDQLKASAPDLAAVRTAAGKIEASAQQLETWFPAGSSKADGMKTHALQAVWNKPEEFRQVAANFKVEAGKYSALVQSSDIAVHREGMKALGGACKQCHDKFREPD